MTPRQEAMFNAVIDQHGQNIPSDIFPFSWYKAQQYFASNGDAAKFGIDPLSDHIDLLKELAEIGAIKIQMIKIEEYSDIPINREDPEWQEYLIPIDGDYYICDICMNNKDAHRAKYDLCKRYKARLVFDNNDCTLFHVHIDADKDYYFRQLREDGYPYKVFKYAFEQWDNGREEPISRQDLIDHKRMRDDQPSVKNLFKDLPVIKEALSPFIDIQPGSVKFKGTEMSISENERAQIQKHSQK